MLTTAVGKNVTLTAGHHVPMGASCCSTLKTAGTVQKGEQIWLAAPSGAAVGAAVTKITKVAKQGLHSPVLTNGNFPVVDSVVTSFDSIRKVTAAGYGLPVLEAAGMTELFRRVALDGDRKFI